MTDLRRSAQVRTPAPVTPQELAAVRADTVDIAGAVEFWDITNREDYHVVEMQQQGTRSRSWTSGRYSNQEASVHAFDIMVPDRYANDGSHTVRGWRTETANERRLVTRILGPAQQADPTNRDRRRPVPPVRKGPAGP